MTVTESIQTQSPLLGKTVATAALLLACAFAPTDAAAFTYSGDITYTSNYIFRGVSQSDEAAAVQGGYSLDLGFGVQVGTWGSNVSFGRESPTTLELDSFGSIGFDLSGDIGAEIGIVNYHYTQAGELDFAEVYGNLYLLGISASVATSDDYEASGSPASWLKVGYELPLLTRTIYAGVEYGQVQADEEIFTETTLDASGAEVIERENSYGHFGGYLSFRLAGSELRVTVTNTNRIGCEDICGTQSSVSWTKTF